ncbi:medium-chain fatty acid-CoA ligase faa2 [Pestalotiopsis sp. IQ-011]
MSSPVADLESGLNVMLGNKPPGVSGSQIKNITALCVNNVQSESVLIQKIFTHFKKTPGTHKLGVLYVVDSVTRRWIDQAKQQSQAINSSAPDGTFAAGVHRVTELIPVLMNDILQSAPEDQKEKIKKLVDIWEKGQTFPASLIESFKQKLSALKNESTTPVGSPPPGPGLPGLPGFNVSSSDKPAAAGAPSDIMEALKKIAQQNISVAPSNSAVPALTPASDSFYVQRSTSAQQNGALAPQQPPPLPVTQSQPAFPFSAAPPPPVNAAMPFAYPPSGPAPGHVPAFPVTASSQPAGFPGMPAMPAMPPQVPGVDPAAAQQVQLIQLLAQQGIPPENIPALLAAFQSNNPVTQTAPVPAVPAGPLPFSNAWGHDQQRPDASQNRNFGGRSPNRYQNRSRSRSPARHWGSRDSPRGRNERYGRDSPAHGRDDRSGWGGDYRQRSPPGRRGRSRSPNRFDQPQPGQKWVEFDRALPPGHIKVLSRTLFVGGVTCSEAELRSMFSRSGQVQTCIVNKDKRHAFVKMLARKDAVAAKEAMENSQYRTRWGVGFGPRDCSDYSSGISVIPINKLTEADRKWMLSAEWGGSGGRPIEAGMVVEEPDIEIGAGVSSKAISRRMQTDRGGKHGPKSSRGDDDDSNMGRWKRNKDNSHHRRDEHHNSRDFGNNNGNSQQPMVPDFPYGIPTGNNGMPMFPPGFAFPMPPSQ